MVVAYLDFSKVFGIVSHDILISKLRSASWTSGQWVDKSLNGRAQKVMISAQSLVEGMSLVVSFKG